MIAWYYTEYCKDPKTIYKYFDIIGHTFIVSESYTG